MWELSGAADLPPSSAKLTDRVPFTEASTTLLLRVPPINAQRTAAVEAVLDAQLEKDRKARVVESRARETAELNDVGARVRALATLRRDKTTPVSTPEKTPGAVSGLDRGSTRAAAVATLCAVYAVSVDSPFFSAPRRVYVPLPLLTLAPRVIQQARKESSVVL